MRWWWLLVMALSLTACSKASKFETRIDRSPAVVYAALSQSSLGPLGTLVPGLKLHRTRPSDTDILYTIAGDATDQQTSLLFSLEPVDGGMATIIHSEITVPRIKLEVNGKTKVLSQALAKKEVARILDAYARNGSAASTRTQLSSVLGALAIATEKKFQAVVKNRSSEQAFLALLEGADPEALVRGNDGWANGEFGSDNQGRRVTDASYSEFPDDGSEWGN